MVQAARPGNERLLRASLYWHDRLKSAGVPIAPILHADLGRHVFSHPYVILERLAGSDLEKRYPELSRSAKLALAAKMVEIQCATASLPTRRGFGHAFSYEEPGPHRSWSAVIQAEIERLRTRIHSASILRPEDVDRLERATAALDGAFFSIQACALLDDATSKNVIVDPSGALTGIVDVDSLCSGDSLFPLALTRAAFAKLGYDAEYTNAWKGQLQSGERSRACLHFYTALFSAVILSEHGLRFNQPVAATVDHQGADRLKRLFDEQLRSCA